MLTLLRRITIDSDEYKYRLKVSRPRKEVYDYKYSQFSAINLHGKIGTKQKSFEKILEHMLPTLILACLYNDGLLEGNYLPDCGNPAE